MHLADHDDIGIVIADKPGGGHREDTKFLADTLALTSYGTKYVKPNRIEDVGADLGDDGYAVRVG
jgi:hypothetical protein